MAELERFTSLEGAFDAPPPAVRLGGQPKRRLGAVVPMYLQRGATSRGEDESALDLVLVDLRRANEMFKIMVSPSPSGEDVGLRRTPPPGRSFLCLSPLPRFPSPHPPI